MAARSAAEPAKEHRVIADFILLSEFAEIRHGPVPICTVPECGEGSFDTVSFSVRVFSTDFQQGQSEDFAICPDSQVLLTEPSEGIFAYVHYFALNDIQARGYMRQYCLSYLTCSPSKLIDHFERFKEDFSEVTRLFKCANHNVFKTDIEQRLLDLEFSLNELDRKDGEKTDGHSAMYDSCTDDIPETNKLTLKKDADFTKWLLDVIHKEMDTESNIRVHRLIRNHASTNVDVQNVPRAEGNSLFYTSTQFTQTDYKPKRIMAHLSQRFTRQQRSLNELSYEGYALAMAKLRELHKKYSRSEGALSMELLEMKLLNPFSSLLTVGRVPLMNVLDSPLTVSCANYKLTSSSPSNEEVQFNLADHSGFSLIDTLQQGEPTNQLLYLDPSPRQRMVSVYDPLGTPHENSFLFSPDPRLPISASQHSSYQTPDTIPSPPPESGSAHFTPPPKIDPKDIAKKLEDIEKSSEKEAESGEMESEKKTVTVKSKGGKARGRSQSTDQMLKESSRSELTRSLPQSHLTKTNALPQRLKLPSLNRLFSNEAAFSTPVATIPPVSYDFPFTEEQPSTHTQCGFPFISSVDLVENSSCNKPGKDLVTLFKDVPELRDILYCLLVGRPLVIIASPRDEKLVRRHIKALWLFVAGHSSHYQVISWQECSFDLEQLGQVRLAGVACPTNDKKDPIPQHLKKHVSYWDWTTNKLCVPTYTGSLLNPILSRARDKKNEELFLVLIESILLELSFKSFVYYHGYCLQSELTVMTRNVSPPEAAPRKLHSVSAKKDKVLFLGKLSIKEGDIEIVEHLTRVVKEQQLSAIPHNNPQDRPLKIVVKNHYCQDRVCKLKRPHQSTT